MSSLLLAVLATAYAADPVFVGTERPPAEVPEEPAPPETKLGAQIGGILATGNTDSYTFTAGINASHKAGDNQVRVGVVAANGKAIPDLNADGRVDQDERNKGRVETSRNLGGEARYDRFFGEMNSLYGLVGALHDPFQGYDLRSHAQLGYSRTLVKTETTVLLAEIGGDVARENYLEGVDPNGATIIAARGLVGTTITLNDIVTLTETFEAYENVIDTDDLRLINDLGVQAKLSGALALKLGHKLVFDNVPVEGFRKTDQTVTVTLVATIL